MSVALQEDADGEVLIVILSGTLSTEDYDRLVPEVERLIKQHGKIRMLVQMHDFHGWTVARCGKTSSSTPSTSGTSSGWR